LEIEGFAVHLHADARALLDDTELPRDGCLVIDPGTAAQTPRSDACYPHHPRSEFGTQRSSAIETLIIDKPLLGTTLVEALRKILGKIRGC
jgi:hypothetical protein